MSTELLSPKPETKLYSSTNLCLHSEDEEWNRPKLSGYVRVKYFVDRLVAIGLLFVFGR